ncbi:DAN domain family member 5 [Lepisosteus oculatus]|uniref:DAN domain family member 5 n=1 Tax=Lepisosteus oculatus TaxID=7918 RepID=UPI0035F51EAF
MVGFADFLLCASLIAAAGGFPPNALESLLAREREPESSGNGPGLEGAVRGTVRVVKVSPQFLRQSEFFRRGSHARGALPPFLALGRPGPAVPPGPGALPGPRPRADVSAEADNRKKQGLLMWRAAIEKGDSAKETLALPVNLKEPSKQSCAAVPFTQRVTAAGCETVTVRNQLCFGQCTSLYVPPGGEAAGTGPLSAACSRCGPAKSRLVLVPLRCLGAVAHRERRVLQVEECRCETRSADDGVTSRGTPHLLH